MPYERIEGTVLKALHGIRALGLKVGLISNCASEEVAAWPHSQLAPLFDVVDFSCETHHMKPEPEAYLLACRRLEVSPTQAVFVGDGGSDELAGAVRVGMVPVWSTWHLRRWPHWNRNSHPHECCFSEARSPPEIVEHVRELLTIEPSAVGNEGHHGED